MSQSTVIAEPDYLLEPLSLYAPNRTYLTREGRFGKVVIFSRSARLSLSLGDILATARSLRISTQRPVIILLHERLENSVPDVAIQSGYNWTFTMTRRQVGDFLKATQRVERLAPASTDESFDVYRLD